MKMFFTPIAAATIGFAILAAQIVNAQVATAQTPNDAPKTRAAVGAPILASGANPKTTALKSGISGPGEPVVGDGSGGWRTGSSGVLYQGPKPKTGWDLNWGNRANGSAIKDGLLPPIKPIWELHLRDTVVITGGDGNYYMTGSSGDNIWDFNDGVELWRSSDLKKWDYVGLVWSVHRDGTWEKQPKSLHGVPTTVVWAPEIHYVKNNYFLCLSMAPGGISILKSTTGKPEGPYVNALSEDKPLANGIDATLFQDDDGAVYFTYSGGNRIARMKDDMSGLAEPFRAIKLDEPDHNPRHHAAKCEPRGMNDLGHEGAVLFKANGKYYLGAADNYEGRYSTCLAMSDNIYGPYKGRHESVPSGGGTNFFKDKAGQWWSAYFGNDDQSPFREKAAIVRVEFAPDGKVKVAKQPDFVLRDSAKIIGAK